MHTAHCTVQIALCTGSRASSTRRGRRLFAVTGGVFLAPCIRITNATIGGGNHYPISFIVLIFSTHSVYTKARSRRSAFKRPLKCHGLDVGKLSERRPPGGAARLINYLYFLRTSRSRAERCTRSGFAVRLCTYCTRSLIPAITYGAGLQISLLIPGLRLSFREGKCPPIDRALPARSVRFSFRMRLVPLPVSTCPGADEGRRGPVINARAHSTVSLFSISLTPLTETRSVWRSRPSRACGVTFIVN